MKTEHDLLREDLIKLQQQYGVYFCDVGGDSGIYYSRVSLTSKFFDQLVSDVILDEWSPRYAN